MKKAMVLVSLLAVLGSGFVFADTLGTSTLKLNYLKNMNKQYSIGWYAEQSDNAVAKASDSFNTATGETVYITAYLKAISNYSPNMVTLSVKLPSLKNDDYGTGADDDSSTIGYTATLTSTTAATTSLLEASLTSDVNPTDTDFATIPANASLAQASWIKFVFTPNASDLADATANKAYSGDVIVTMSST